MLPKEKEATAERVLLYLLGSCAQLLLLPSLSPQQVSSLHSLRFGFQIIKRFVAAEFAGGAVSSNSSSSYAAEYYVFSCVISSFSELFAYSILRDNY